MSTAVATQRSTGPVTAQPQAARVSLLAKIASKYSVEPEKMLATLTQTAFKGDKPISNEQMMALLIVADQYNLNPWTREIYAFPAKGGGIVPVVGVDGWTRIINESPAFDGIEFKDGPLNDKQLPEWIECSIYRKDRSRPVTTREYMAECKRGTDPWNTHPRRMLRHKSMIQCARIAFAFAGIFDEDEAQRVIEGSAGRVPEDAPTIDSLNRGIIEGSVSPDPKPDAEKTDVAPTYAEIADKINKATGDELDDAVSLVHVGLPEAQRKELIDLAKARRLELA